MQKLKLFEKRKARLIIICLFALIPYLNIFQNEFVIDDKAFVSWANLKSLNDIPSILKGEVPSGHEGVYRPLRGVVYLVYAEVFGVNPFWMHLNSIVVNILSSILIYLIATKILKSHLLGFFAAIIFASHPVHTEAITYISASMDSTGLVFMLASFYLYLLSHSRPFRVIPAKAGIHIMSYLFGFRIKSGMTIFKSRMTLYIGSIVSAWLAFFTYEMTLTLPFLIIFYDLVILNSFQDLNRFRIKSGMTFLNRLKIYLPYFLSLVIYLVIRILSVGISGRAPYPGDSVYITFLTMLKVFVEYIKLIFFPIGQINNHILSGNIESFIYRGYNISNFKTQSLFSLDILSYLIIYIAIFIICLKTFKKYPIISFCVGAFFILMLPASEIIPQGSVMNERLIYGASFPIILLFVWVLSKFLKNKIILLVSCLGISVIFAVLTSQRNLDWKNEIVLWSKDIKKAPEANAYAYFQLGNTFRNNQQYSLAAENFSKAYEINPNFTVALASRAQIHDITGNETQAIKLYEEILSKDPYFWEAYRERGKIFMQQKKFDEAKTEFETLLMIYPSNQEAQQFLLIIESMRLENEKRK